MAIATVPIKTAISCGLSTRRRIIVSGLVIAIVAGMIIGRLKLERYVEDFVWKMQAASPIEGEKLTWSDRIQRAWISVKEIVAKVWLIFLAIHLNMIFGSNDL